jgi:hypothetical protein
MATVRLEHQAAILHCQGSAQRAVWLKVPSSRKRRQLFRCGSPHASGKPQAANPPLAARITSAAASPDDAAMAM